MCSPFTDSGNLHLHACHHQCRLQSRKGVWLQNEGISTPCITISASQLNKGSRDELNSCLHLQVQMPQRSNSEMVDVLSLRSAGGFSSSSTVNPSHISPAPASSHQPSNSIFFSHHSSSSLQLQPAERSGSRRSSWS